MKEIFLNLPDITLTVELLESIVKANEDKLERIIDSISVPKECNSVQLIAKLKRIINNEEEVLAPYEILMLSFSCAALSKDDLSFYLEMFADKHKSLDLLQGLIFSLIRVWNNYDCRSLLISFIAKNKSLLNKRLSDVSSFFLYDDGPRLLGSAMRNKDIFAAPKMICLDCEWINSDYFEQVILKYFNEKPISHEILKTIESLLKKIAKVRLNKQLLPDIVIRFDQESKNESLRNTLTSLCLRMIGTIEEPTRWEESSFDEKQRRALVNCKNIIKRWQVERSISLVFDKIGCARYPDRSRYWKRFRCELQSKQFFLQRYLYGLFCSQKRRQNPIICCIYAGKTRVL